MIDVVLVSGGMDSGITLAWVKNNIKPKHLVGLSVNYGQKHSKELWYANQLTFYYGAIPKQITIPKDLMKGSALTGFGEIPKNLDYRDVGQKSTVVAGRNLVLISIAVAEAVKIGAERVYFSGHKGDADVYPDCRPDFIDPLSKATKSAYGVEIVSPFITKTKKEIAEIGKQLNFPFDLSWSCYEGGNTPCKKCGACVERMEALQNL